MKQIARQVGALWRSAIRESWICKEAVSVVLVLGCGAGAQAAPIIDLSNPVSDSISTITGIYWTGNTITVGSPNDTTPDSSGNGYTGNLLVMGGTSISSTTGVNLAGTSGYGNGIRLATNATAPGGSGNPEILVNLAVTNNLSMVGTDFSGGAWLNFSSILSGAQTVTVMNRGVWNSAAQGSWGLNLVKDASGNWQMAFQVGNGSLKETEFLSIPTEMTITTGAWHHFGFSYDFVDGGNNVVTFWMDGVSLGTADFSIDITAGTTTGERRFTVGERGSSTYNSVFNGTVDDVFVTTGLYEFQAVPEPGTCAMIALAGLFVVLRRWRSTGTKGCTKGC